VDFFFGEYCSKAMSGCARACVDASRKHTSFSTLLEDALGIVAVRLSVCLSLHTELKGIVEGLKGFPESWIRRTIL
jgi:hypothetical protein